MLRTIALRVAVILAGIASLFLAAFLNLWIPAANAGSWTGCYGGVHGGYTAALSDMSLNGPLAFGPNPPTGEWVGLDSLGGDDFSYGLNAGCDMRVAPKIVLGVWGDYTWDQAAWDVTVLGGFGAPALATFELENRWAVGGRAGYIVNGSLLYVLLGYTEADTSAINSPLAGGGLAVPTLKGYVVGGGAEFPLGNNLALQTQYTFSDYEDENIGLGGPWSVGVNTDVHAAQAALVYRFDFAGDKLPGFEPAPLK